MCVGVVVVFICVVFFEWVVVVLGVYGSVFVEFVGEFYR